MTSQAGRVPAQSPSFDELVTTTGLHPAVIRKARKARRSREQRDERGPWKAEHPDPTANDAIHKVTKAGL
ncbi:hypothetical protein ncot_13500 [Nocardioides sp. JQ2195]|uniref:hypothetical protein n=1 Tax=Nocardioides sp. JQ2195 TaxID=2592334 RepID=UPI00143EBF64|nr:hypothetical protein [Nocardioides sp. JQ2195]QIX27511.1 hypothetical protein ncot_13500 [Nocardioides sp. JQ2195]